MGAARFLALACGLVACGARSPLEGGGEATPVDVEDASVPQDASVREAAVPRDAPAPPDALEPDVAPPPPPPPATCAIPDAGAGPALCTLDVRVTALSRSSPGCFVDAVIAVGQKGTLELPCAGDGSAVVRFPPRALAGIVAGGVLDTCVGTSFPFSDGCEWNSAQRVTGPVATKTLTFSYAEAPAPGQSQCDSPCTATGTIVIE